MNYYVFLESFWAANSINWGVSSNLVNNLQTKRDTRRRELSESSLKSLKECVSYKEKEKSLRESLCHSSSDERAKEIVTVLPQLRASFQ